MTVDSPPTLKSIAELAGVSPMAVSLALRNSPRISDSTRDRIRSIAERLGYHPNSFATSLVSLRSLTARHHRGTLALLNCHQSRTGWRSSPTFCRLHRGLQRRAEDLGYTLDEFWFGDPEMPNGRLEHMLDSRGIHGIIFAFYHGKHEQVCRFRGFDFSRFACVTINRRIPDRSVFLVSNDQYQIASLAFDRLLQRGYRRIGLVLNEEAETGLEYRLRGGLMATTSHLPKPGRIPVLNVAEPGAEDLHDWILRTRVDAVLAFPRDIHHRLQKRSIAIPEQIGLACLDRATLDDGLAGIDQNSELVGSMAVDVLTSQIHNNERGNPTHQKSLYIDGQWVDGWSVRQKDTLGFEPLSALRQAAATDTAVHAQHTN